MATLFEEWNEYLNLKRLSERSIKEYNNYYKSLDINRLSPEYLNGWVSRNNHSPGRAFLNNFVQFVLNHPKAKQEMKLWLVTYKIPRLTGRVKSRIPQILSRVQVHQLAKGMNEREKWMVLLTFYCGLRCAELLSLTLQSIDFEKGLLRVIGKGNKERIIPIVPELLIRFGDYIKGEIKKNADFNVLFPISDRHWRKQLHKKSKQLVGFYVHPHTLRHSCGSYLHNKGLDLKEIAELLGHESVETTQIYVHLDKSNLDLKMRDAFR